MTFITKLMEKSPLKYPLTKGLRFLDPSFILIGDATDALKTSLNIILQSNILSARHCELADREFKELISLAATQELLKSYCKREERLDDFWFTLIGKKPEYSHLLKVVKLCLILSHGNANVERGFSVNKEILVENLKESSLIAQRIIYDSLAPLKNVTDLKIDSKLIHSVRNSSSKYKEALEAMKLEKDSKSKEEEEKRKAKLKLEEIEERKRKLLEEASVLEKQAKEIKKHKLL